MSLAELRKEIDAIDDILVQAFADRMDLVAQVAEEKKKIAKPVLDKGRERDKLADIASKLPPELEQYGYTLWNMLFEISRSYQSSLQGEPSTLRVEIEQAMEATPPLFPPLPRWPARAPKEPTPSRPARRSSSTLRSCTSAALTVSLLR